MIPEATLRAQATFWLREARSYLSVARMVEERNPEGATEERQCAARAWLRREELLRVMRAIGGAL